MWLCYNEMIYTTYLILRQTWGFEGPGYNINLSVEIKMFNLSTHSRVVSAWMKSEKSNCIFWVDVGSLKGGGLVGMKLASSLPNKHKHGHFESNNQ